MRTLALIALLVIFAPLRAEAEVDVLGFYSAVSFDLNPKTKALRTAGESWLRLRNRGKTPLREVVLWINPNLTVGAIRGSEKQALRFRTRAAEGRTEITVTLPRAIGRFGTVEVAVAFDGEPRLTNGTGASGRFVIERNQLVLPLPADAAAGGKVRAFPISMTLTLDNALSPDITDPLEIRDRSLNGDTTEYDIRHRDLGTDYQLVLQRAQAG